MLTYIKASKTMAWVYHIWNDENVPENLLSTH